MNRIVQVVVGVLIGAATPSLAQDLSGHWEGVLRAGGEEIRTVLHLSLVESGEWTGTADSPEQGAFGLDLDDVEFEAGAFSFTVPATHAKWTGRLSEDGDELAGTWEQRGSSFALSLARVELDALAGAWHGTLEVAGIKLPLVFHVGVLANGDLGATMMSPDQSSQPIPVAAVTRDGDELEFDIAVAGATYAAKWDRAADALVGEFRQGPVKSAMTMERSGPAPKRRRPQTPQSPFPYRSEDVRYENSSAGIHLAGTLTVPEGDGPFPVALLITGSGAQDRDESLLGHKPFLVLADHLSRRGVAVLRVDDRGVGGSGGSMATSTSEDFVTDVQAGFDFLKSRSEIDGAKIGLIGHSEGGMIAPMVASENSEVAFAVLLAGPGIPGDEILYQQAALIAEAQGAPAEAIEANRQSQKAIFEILGSDDDLAEVKTKIRQLMREALEQAGAEAADAAVEVQTAQVANPWFRYFVQFDPVPYLSEVSCPVLAVNGELDLQVPCKANLDGIAAALDEAGNPDFTVRAFPGLNHLFQNAKVGDPSEYQTIEETFSVEVLDVIHAWIAERFIDDE